MNFEISSENKLVADTVRRFIKERLAPLEAGIDAADEIDPAVIRALKQDVIALGFVWLQHACRVRRARFKRRGTMPHR